MVVNPLLSVLFLAMGYGTALACRRYGWFPRCNFMLLTVASWVSEVLLFSIAIGIIAALKA